MEPVFVTKYDFSGYVGIELKEFRRLFLSLPLGAQIQGGGLSIIGPVGILFPAVPCCSGVTASGESPKG